jgi:hypothetical protein
MNNSILNSKNKAKTYFELAKFYDNLYNLTYKKSISQEMKDIKESLSSTEKIIDPKQLKTLEQQKKIYDNNLELVKSNLKFTFSNFCNVLKFESKYDLYSTFKVCFFWFKYCEVDFINNLFENEIKEIQNHKFLPLIFQIVGRIGIVKNDKFNKNLFDLLFSIAMKHPYHTLHHILSMKNSSKNEDLKFIQTKSMKLTLIRYY